MHDIVRDYVRNSSSRHRDSGSSSSELARRTLQRSIVDVVLAARPEPNGFVNCQYVDAGSFEGYVARHLFWHMRGALAEGEEPPDEWITHEDTTIRGNAATAVGVDALVAISAAREAAGELVRAAQASWAASNARFIDPSRHCSLVWRAIEILQHADNEQADEFELEITMYAQSNIVDAFSPENTELLKRGKVLAERSCAATYDSCLPGVAFAQIAGYTKLREGDVDGALEAFIQTIRLSLAAGALLKNKPSITNYYNGMVQAHLLGFIIVASPNPKWDPNVYGGSEASLVNSILAYRYHVCGPLWKAHRNKVDQIRKPIFVSPLALYYGNIATLELWRQKVFAAFSKIDPASNGYRDEHFELYHFNTTAAPLFIMLGLGTRVTGFYEAFGFGWHEEGFRNFEILISIVHAFVPVAQESESIFVRLALFLSAREGDIDVAAVNKWMPSPQEFADMERLQPVRFFQMVALYEITSFGARAFLKLGRDDDAYELARLAVSPEQNTVKKTTLVSCHSILGQVAAKRGELEAADGHFADALAEAKLSRLPMLEVLAARDWKRHLLAPKGRDCGAAEAAIDGACAKMKKTREQLARVLEG